MPPASAGGIITVNLIPTRLTSRKPPASAGGSVTFRLDEPRGLEVTIPLAKARGFQISLV